jgi:hypothetical protein
VLEFCRGLLYSPFMFKLFWHRYYWEMEFPTGTVLMSKKCKRPPPLVDDILSVQSMTEDPDPAFCIEFVYEKKGGRLNKRISRIPTGFSFLDTGFSEGLPIERMTTF